MIAAVLQSCSPHSTNPLIGVGEIDAISLRCISLCGPISRSVEGRAFRPVRAIPVDLFPHTPHCEMVMVFERLPQEVEAADDAPGAQDEEVKEDAL